MGTEFNLINTHCEQLFKSVFMEGTLHWFMGEVTNNKAIQFGRLGF